MRQIGGAERFIGMWHQASHRTASSVRFQIWTSGASREMWVFTVVAIRDYLPDAL